MTNETMIPILPCRSIKDTLEFYVAMGFEITYQQERPNTYACVKRDGIDLHFFTLKEYDPAQSYSTCLVIVSNAESLRQAFVDGLRQHYGKLPAAGIPRLTHLRNKSEGGRGFNIIDPGGNWIRITQPIDTTASDEISAKAAPTKLSRALNAAELLADSKGDAVAAAKLLDKALADDEPMPTTQRVQALIMRAGLAITMDDQALARKIIHDMRQIILSDDERTALVDELQRADDFAQMLQE